MFVNRKNCAFYHFQLVFLFLPNSSENGVKEYLISGQTLLLSRKVYRYYQDYGSCYGQMIFGCILHVADAISVLLICPQLFYYIYAVFSWFLYSFTSKGCTCDSLTEAIQELFEPFCLHAQGVKSAWGIISPIGSPQPRLTGILIWQYENPALYSKV